MGASNQQMTGVRRKLVTITIGRSRAACADRLGLERTVVAPTPNKTELTSPKSNSAMLIRVDIAIDQSVPASSAVEPATAQDKDH